MFILKLNAQTNDTSFFITAFVFLSFLPSQFDSDHGQTWQNLFFLQLGGCPRLQFCTLCCEKYEPLNKITIERSYNTRVLLGSRVLMLCYPPPPPMWANSFKVTRAEREHYRRV